MHINEWKYDKKNIINEKSSLIHKIKTIKHNYLFYHVESRHLRDNNDYVQSLNN